MNDDELQPIECRAAVEILPIATNHFNYLPKGLHEINPVSGGIGRPIKVKIDERTADAIEEQRKIIASKGKRPYFDFNHGDDRAAFWPAAFIWDPNEGVVAKGEWSASGRAAIEGKDYRAFSPVFHVDNKRADPASVVCKAGAEPNMGGFVNNPAFNNLAVWSKNAGAPALSQQQQQNGEQEMNTEETATLRAKIKELEDKITAKNAEGEEDTPEVIAAKAEKRWLELEIENADLKASNASKTEAITKQREKDAKDAVKEAVSNGALRARDVPSLRRWEKRIIADPSVIDDLKALPRMGGLSNQIIGGNGRYTITAEEPARIFGTIATKLSLSRRTPDYRDRMVLSREIAGIYAREMGVSVIRAGSASAERILAFPVPELQNAIMAADVTDTDLDTLSGTLVTQRTLELLKLDFPSLGMFTTDFSDQSAQFNQTVMTRTVDIPSVVTYNTTTGWANSTATTQDVPVTIDKHEGVNITFNENILASTIRRLFDEFAPAQAYALAKSMVDDLYSNITDANFTNNTVKATSSFARSDVIDIGVALDIRGVH